MNIEATPISGVFAVETTRIADNRGSFARFFCDRELVQAFAGRRVVQINHSYTRSVGAVRGLHVQFPPSTESKMVRCLRGRVFDVAVDLRAGSPTFLQWFGLELDAQSFNALIIPGGCAHGFQVMKPGSELLYLHTAYYSPGHEGGVAHDDPRIGVSWPLRVTDLSLRDQSFPKLDPAYRGIFL